MSRDATPPDAAPPDAAPSHRALFDGPAPTTVPGLAARGRVHLVGVGGAGMSTVAALLAARGLEVSGSDARPGPVLDRLRSAGVTVHVGHEAAHVDGAGSLVVSTAIRATNPELARAQELGLPVLHRSDALAALMADRRSVAVAGAHGKTTTSAMIAVTLTHAGLDPSYAVGAALRTTARDLVGGAHDGSGDVFVAEADESDRSFLAYRPDIAVVTNIEPDHLDQYGTPEAFEQAFEEFAARIVPGGHLVACADDPGSRRLADAVRRSGTQVVTYGTAEDADVKVGPWRADPADRPVGTAPAPTTGGRTTVQGPDGARAELRLQVPGEHNALDAAAAWTVARLIGVDAEAAAAGLASFTGTSRRFEDRGSVAGVRLVDDYAHNPAKVAALLGAAREVAAGGRVLVLFQPHLYSRTAAFAGEFAAALEAADVVVVTGVYGAREDPDPTVSGALIADRVGGGRARYVEDARAAAAAVGHAARPGDLVLTVGAGDVTELAPVVLAAVREAQVRDRGDGR